MRHSTHSVSAVKLSIGFILALFTSAVCAETMVFTAPPRESVEKGQSTYGPIASYLSSVLNKKIVYKHPGNWLSYSSDMRKGKYDMVFDGPHFVSWRINRLNHTPLVKIPGGFIFRFVADKANSRVTKVDDLVGRKVCGHAPPNQGTLRLYNQFKNPMRLPILVTQKGWRNIYDAMLQGKCEVAILPDKIYKKVDPKSNQSKVLFTSNPVPGQAITASPRFNRVEIANMRKALLTKEGMEATANLRKRFASPTLTAATRAEYDGIHELLADSHGFSDNAL